MLNHNGKNKEKCFQILTNFDLIIIKMSLYFLKKIRMEVISKDFKLNFTGQVRIKYYLKFRVDGAFLDSNGLRVKFP